MTLSQVLLRYVFRASLFVVGIAAVLAALAIGLDAAMGLVVGAVLSIGDAAAMIFIVGELLAPSGGGARKAFLGALLAAKLVVVGALLWISYDKFGVSGLGLVLGIGVGLTATIIGVARGSASSAGQEAIARAESAIAKEMEDSRNQTR
jgi:hypothetical protein